MISRLRSIFRSGANARGEFIDSLHEHMAAQDLASAIAALSIKGSGDDAALSVEIGVLSRTMRLLNGLEFDELEFPLVVKPSPVCTAAVAVPSDGSGGSNSNSSSGGVGVFASAPIPAGRIVATYPGAVYTASQLRSLGGSRYVDPRGLNEYIMFRSSDGACFDAAPIVAAAAAAGPQGQDPAVSDDRGGKSARAAAVGHLLNHSAAPNALPWPVDLEDRDAARLAPWLHAYDGMAFHAMGVERRRPSTALLPILTTRDVAAGEELFIDYRLDLGMDPATAAEALPAWYELVPDASGERPIWVPEAPPP